MKYFLTALYFSGAFGYYCNFLFSGSYVKQIHDIYGEQNVKGHKLYTIPLLESLLYPVFCCCKIFSDGSCRIIKIK